MVYLTIELGVFGASAMSAHFFNAQKTGRRGRRPLQMNDWRKIMENYKEMYYILFNAITKATRILEEAQKKVEEIFINQQ